MKKRPGNPNWGKPELGIGVSTPTEFEQLARELELQPSQYVGSERLRQWAEQNRHSRYVPESLLVAWGLGVVVKV